MDHEAEEEAEEEGTVGAPAARVLHFAVGLLGLELHEEPNPWAETWMEALSVGEVSFGAEKKIAREVDEGYWLDRDFKMLVERCLLVIESKEKTGGLAAEGLVTHAEVLPEGSFRLFLDLWSVRLGVHGL